MTLRENYRLHTLLMTVLFVLGNAIITFPKRTANINTFLGFIVAFLLSLLLAAPVCKAVDFVFDTAHLSGKFSKIITAAVYCATLLLIVLDSAVCVTDYVGFVSQSILPDASKLVIAAVLLGVVFWSATRPDTTILKFSLISFVIVAAIVVLFFVFSLKNMSIEYIFLLSLPDWKDVFFQTLPYLSGVFLSIITTFIYQKLTFARQKISDGILSLGIAAGLFAMVLLNSILLFSSPLAGEYRYPYADAISVVSIGDLFTRMDGFAYFVFFATCLIKLTVSVFVIKVLVSRLGFTHKKITAAIATVIIFVSGIFLL